MKQITLLTDDRLGVISHISQLLGNASINILSLEADAAQFHGVIVLSVDQDDLALNILTKAGYRAISEDTLLVAMEDTPGALARIAVRLEEAKINIRSLHILSRRQDQVLVSLVTDDNEMSSELLADALVAGNSS